MENKNIIIWLGLFLILGLSACSEKTNEQIQTDGEGLPVFATLDTRSLPSELSCDLYIFWKPISGNDYTFKQKIDLTGETLPYQMQFSYKDTKDKQYRFLFIAQPTNAKKMQVSNNGSTFADGDNWLNLKIETTEQYLNHDYYYGILDKTGAEIVADGNIHGELYRLVGQIALDIFRMEEDADHPIGIKSAFVGSVLDRIHTIEIEYTGLTKSISFDIAGNIMEKESWPASYKQTINLTLGDTLQVSLPQEEIGVIAGETAGSVRVKGVCGFTSSPKIRAKYTFTYYGTTPINEIFYHFHNRDCYGKETATQCGYTYAEQHTHNSSCYNKTTGELICTKDVHVHTSNCYDNDIDPSYCNYPEHAHEEDCFDDAQKLVLNLPQETGYSKLLNIVPNTYTVNKAGIRMDRIIDLDQSASLGFDVAWENEKN